MLIIWYIIWYSPLRSLTHLRLLSRVQKPIYSFIFEAFALVLKLPAACTRVLSLSLSFSLSWYPFAQLSCGRFKMLTQLFTHRFHEMEMWSPVWRDSRAECKQNFSAFNQKQRNRHELQFNWVLTGCYGCPFLFPLSLSHSFLSAL